MDPLRLIRDYYVKGLLEKSTHDDTHVHLDELNSFPRKGVTNYKAKMGKGYLTVEAIWFFARAHALNPKEAHPQYMAAALKAKFDRVSLIERKDLLEYITGKVDVSANVDVTAPALTAPEDEDADARGGRKRGAAGDAMDVDDDENRAPIARTMHTRNSVLQCDKDFSVVLGFFGAAAGGGGGGDATGDGKKAKKPENIAPIKSNRFGDVKQDEFMKEHLGEGFADLGIDVNASFLDSKKPSRLASVTGGGGGGASGLGAASTRRDPSEGAMPLIIVPAGYGKALFNMYNVAEFLANEKLVTWDSVHKSGGKKHSNIVFKRRYKRDRSIKYEVTDKAPDKRSPDWARVVAVFVSGKEWQFKNWPFQGADDGDLVDCFQKVKGFYAQYDTDKAEDIIKKWNVKTLRFQKNVRHGDRAQFEAFWADVDAHLELRRSKLAY
ncbi:PAF1 complex protein Cdc73 [Micromonas pusilla CCMP1545]|uniref:PAF1 complex protein Cdc73 n=1 Tax=Micromonas pusilla (strain CCMP1545) TaxID=564608 RepID=C1N0W7_MICPC|nr:PAF1 complex protein Cdc73 [Micromonas pusilla CCMP1545]EEH54096.1 PAF1 complex protein Cdc73 [Micromonas pusilla CCMP1545]|eukprot:XP_003061466.1 PAF1 complex protein Cdc73 [Micromonas pusilla CCMP1545]